MQIIYLGNWNVGFLALSKILDSGIAVSVVVTDYDENDCDEYRNKVYELACTRNIPVYKCYREILSFIEKDAVGFSVAYGKEIFKQDILDHLQYNGRLKQKSRHGG